MNIEHIEIGDTADAMELLSALSDITDPDVRAHVRAKASGAWLPAVYSERHRRLRAKLVKEFGRPISSGYMSEECGWCL